SRLGSLLVVTHEPSYLQEVEAWIKRLDTAAATPGRRIYVYDVQNGKSEDLSVSLSKILSISVETAGIPTQKAGRETPQNVETLGIASGTPGGLKIVPNVENNALLIYATPGEFAVIEGALKKLDVPPVQVLIEASLAEVSLTDELRYGLQWAYQGSNG